MKQIYVVIAAVLILVGVYLVPLIRIQSITSSPPKSAQNLVDLTCENTPDGKITVKREGEAPKALRCTDKDREDLTNVKLAYATVIRTRWPTFGLLETSVGCVYRAPGVGPSECKSSTDGP